MPPASPIAAALMSAVAFGFADFIGGRVARRIGAPAAVAIVQAVAALCMLAYMLAGDRPLASGRNLWLGVASGVADGIALMLLYRGFAEGRIGIVAPLSSVLSVTLPALGEMVWVGRVPSLVQALGIMLAGLAVVTLGLAPDERPGTRPLAFSVWIGILGGVLFGLTNLTLGLVAHDQGGGALLVMRAAAAMISVGLAIAMRARPSTDRGVLGLAIVAGLLDAAGMAGYVYASTLGLIAVAAALLSLYGGVTTLLGVVVLKERVSRLQLLGLLTSAASIVLLAASTAPVG